MNYIKQKWDGNPFAPLCSSFVPKIIKFCIICLHVLHAKMSSDVIHLIWATLYTPKSSYRHIMCGIITVNRVNIIITYYYCAKHIYSVRACSAVLL